VREAPVETEENTEEIDAKEFQKSRKESKKEESQTEKYNKKEKTKQAGEESYASKEKRKLKEQEGQAYEKTKGNDRKQKSKAVEEDTEVKTTESNKAESEDEENVACSQEIHAEKKELDVVTASSKKSSCTNKYTVEEQTLEEEPVTLKNEDKSEENVPAKKCYYK
jgi:hypothetical protein